MVTITTRLRKEQRLLDELSAGTWRETIQHADSVKQMATELDQTTDTTSSDDTPAAPIQTPVSADAADAPVAAVAANAARAAKLVERRHSWRWNTKLLAWTLASLLVLSVFGTLSFTYHSRTTAQSFLSLADAAAEEGDYGRQVRWLGRYSLMRPNDQEAIVEVAVAADRAVEVVPSSQRLTALDDSIAELRNAIARLHQFDADVEVRDLRERLIQRLLERGGMEYANAEQQVLALDAEPDDPNAHVSLARAVCGQVLISSYRTRTLETSLGGQGYWESLASQSPAVVLFTAMDMNPGDLDLISNLFAVRTSQPSALDPPPNEDDIRAWEDSVENRLHEAARELAEKDDSRSKRLLFGYLAEVGETEEAAQIARDGASDAFASLESTLEIASTEEGAELDRDAEKQITWDLFLLMGAARSVEISDPKTASRWYDSLMDLPVEIVRPDLAEQICIRAGTFYLNSGDYEKAMSLWYQCLDINENSLTALKGIAAMNLREKASDDATEATLKKLAKAIDYEVLSLARTTDAELPRDTRVIRQRAIDHADWLREVIESEVLRRKGSTEDALKGFHKSLFSKVQVEPSQREYVADALASIHISAGKWDLAAQALSRALDDSPDSDALRMRVAKAWQNAGHRLRESEQWQLVDDSNSFPMQVAACENLFNYQLRVEPDSRNFNSVRTRVEKLLRRAEQGEFDFSSADDSNLSSSLVTLEVLDASLPERGEAAELHLASDEFVTELVEIANKYAENQSVMIFAAERLAASGRFDESEELLSRVELLAGADATPLVVSRARVASLKGENGVASRAVAAQAEIDHDKRIILLEMAFKFAIADEDPELAYRTALKIPEDKRSQSLLLRLASLVGQLTDDSSLLNFDDDSLNTEDKQARRDKLVNSWLKELRRKEGESGTYWKLFEAMRLVEELVNSDKPISRTDERLVRAKKLTDQILVVRPQWGDAVSLLGSLLAIEAQDRDLPPRTQNALYEEAIEQLRRGVAFGDRRIRTRFQIFSLLRRLGKEAEAESVLSQVVHSSDGAFDQFSAMKIDLAIRQGQLDRSLRFAQEGVRAKPDHFESHVVLAGAATIAAKNNADLGRKDELFRLAQASIDQAMELHPADDGIVFSAQLELSLAIGESEAIENDLTAISLSSLPQWQKAMLRYRAHEVTGQLEEAANDLQEAIKLQGTSSRLLALADLYRRMGRSGEEANALRDALKLEPSDPNLRSRLALAMVLDGGAGVDWNEVSGLLSDADYTNVDERLLLASLLYGRGDDEQKIKSNQILREIYAGRGIRSEDAARLLALQIRKTLHEDDGKDDEDKDIDQSSRDAMNSEVRSIFEDLTNGRVAKVQDLVPYGEFLLMNDGDRSSISDADLEKVKSIRNDLIETKEGAVRALELDLELLRGESLPRPPGKFATKKVIEDWLDELKHSQHFESEYINKAAGLVFVQSGEVELGLDYLSQAYREDPGLIATYARELIRAGQTDKALRLCLQHFQEYSDADSAIMLSDALVSSDSHDILPEYQEVFDVALREHKNNVLLLESVATLSMQHGRVSDAINLYERVLRVDPSRVLTLNNLSMAYSETADQAVLAIPLIDRAIRLLGDNPELLDTKGVVLRRLGRLKDAEEVFRTAFNETSEPRFQFHVIATLLDQRKEDEAKQEWAKLKLEDLDPKGLTVKELRLLDRMKKEWGP